MRSRSRGFTLMELLVVVAIIALLVAILVPSLAKAKEMAVTTKCLSNLRQCDIAFNMYSTDWDQCLPYPTTTLFPSSQSVLWFNAIDPYLMALVDSSRSGVAGQRSYQKYKQCPVVDVMLGQKTAYGGTGAQNTTTEYARSYKMNSELRRNNPYDVARVSLVPNPSIFVALGDGISMDTVGSYPSQVDNGQFSMEVNDTTGSATPPSLRHGGGACLAFVDGHAEKMFFPKLTPAIPLGNAPNNPVDRWQSEFLLGGAQFNPGAHYGDATHPLNPAVTRNPAMTIMWSDPGNLYR